jgi:hypothetical protein
MSANHDISRVVRSWIREDEHDSADHILQVVLSRLDSTPQRRSRWPAWRSPQMNRLTTIVVGAAAVLVLAVVAYQFLPTSPVGPSTPSPTPTATPVATPTPAPTPVQAAFPPEGPLAAGTHPAVLDGVPLSFSVPGSGWTSLDHAIEKGEYGQPDYVGIDFWPSAPENVYADPCAHTPLSPPPAASAAGLAAAVATVPVANVVSGPSSIDVGGQPAQHIVLTIGEDIGCEPHDAYLWYDQSTGGATSGWRWAEGLGATYRIWIIDVDGTLVWIDAYTFKGAGPELGQDIQAVIDSIEFE